jgi:glycosyltransferase involved in cell wall biosynthesis
MWQIYEQHVTTFITPSYFLKKMAETFGISARQLVHLPHFIYPDHLTSFLETGDYCAYIGRLSPEKGLTTLLQAMRQSPQANLLLVGEGAERAKLEGMATAWNLQNVTFTGYLGGEALQQTLGRARFTVLPAEWYEVFGQTIIESFLAGRPVIGARIGAIPEVIDHQQNGLLFTPSDATELAACISTLWANPAQTQQMGAHGREKALTVYSLERYYTQLLPLYGR